jgi:3-methyladenine DNA glycosylase AlkD
MSATKKPSSPRPVTKQPATQRPARRKPGAGNPAMQKAAAQKPAVPKPASKSSTAKTSAAKGTSKPEPVTGTSGGAKSPATKPSTAKAGKAAKASPPMPLAETMRELERAGSAQTRKTYARHGATGPMFGVSYATLKALVKRIGVHHELALALWDTGNVDARNLAVKVADPARMTSGDLDRWASAATPRSCSAYVAMLASEGPHAAAKVKQWLAAQDLALRCSGWALVGQMAACDETTPDAFFAERLAHVEKHIHGAPNAEREVMNMAVIQIGGRNAALRKAATAAAKRIGKVDVDHGDTACKTPDAVQSLDKAWAHSTSKGFPSPAAHERSRELLRLRC